MRLDHFLSQSTDLSRAQAKQQIRKGNVQVNAKVVKKAATHVDETAQIEWLDELIETPKQRYIMLNKPQGVVSATKDHNYETVLDLLDIPNKETLHIAGRLDIDTTGLVLITDDGQWSHQIMSPKHKLPKTYYVWLESELTDEQIQQIETGILLKNETKVTKPAKLEKTDFDECRLTITEGKYHQVKRMFAAVGNYVERLHRVSIGDWELDDLEEGEWCYLEVK